MLKWRVGARQGDLALDVEGEGRTGGLEVDMDGERLSRGA